VLTGPEAMKVPSLIIWWDDSGVNEDDGYYDNANYVLAQHIISIIIIIINSISIIYVLAQHTTMTSTLISSPHTSSHSLQVEQDSAFRELVSPLEQRRLKYVRRKDSYGNRSEQVTR